MTGVDRAGDIDSLTPIDGLAGMATRALAVAVGPGVPSGAVVVTVALSVRATSARSAGVTRWVQSNVHVSPGSRIALPLVSPPVRVGAASQVGSATETPLRATGPVLATENE